MTPPPHPGDLVPRYWALERMEAWLGAADPRVFLVTGAPGTGKTLLSAQLAHVRDAVPRAADYPGLCAATVVLAHFCDANDERTLDPLDFVSALSNGLARHVPGFAAALADSVAGTSAVVTIHSSLTVGSVEAGGTVTNVRISVPRDIPTRQAFANLVRRPLEATASDAAVGDLLVIVDDLSGGFAYDPQDNIGQLIGHVAGTTGGRLRFLVTSRSDPWVLRTLPRPALDLVDDRPAETDDIRAYVDGRLGHLDPLLRLAWTDRVTGTAAGNFLYARYALDHVLADESVVLAGPAAHPLPAGLLDLYRTWFRTGIARHRDLWWNCIQPVLTALTAALGTGLTGAQLSGITGLPTSRTRRALEECSQYLTGELPDGPFRLYHDSFREYLTSEEVAVDEGERAVVDFFVGRHGDDWLTADAYAREHLATHLGAVGELAAHAGRPDFMVVAEPTVLLHQLSRLGEDAEVYRRTGWLLAGRDHGERAAYLQLAAHELGEHDLAERFARLPLRRGWAPRWTSLVRHRPGSVVGNHPQGVLDMLTLQAADGSATAVTLSDGSVRLWNLGNHTMTGDFAIPPPLPVTCMTWTSSGGGRVVVAGPHGLVFVDLDRGPVESRQARPDAAVKAVATAFVGGREALVLGYDDGYLEAVDIDTWQQVGEPVRAHDGPVTALTAAYLDAVASAGADGLVAVWVLDTAGFGEPALSLVGQDGWANTCAFFPRDADFVLAGGLSSGAVGWVRRVGDDDLTGSTTDHEPAGWRYGVHAAHSAGYSTSVHTGSGVAGYAEAERRLRDEEREQAEAAERAGPDGGRELPGPSTIVRLSGGVNTIDLGIVDDEVYLASGGEDGRVHLFHLSADPLTGENVVPYGEPVSAVRFAVVDGRMVLVAADSGVSGAVRAWPVGTGPSPLPRAVSDLMHQFTHIASLAGPDGRPLLVAASADGSVTVRDAVTGAALTPALECPDVVLTGLHAEGWDDGLTVAAYGSTTGGDTGAQVDGHAVVTLWQLRSETDVEAWDLRLPELESVNALVGLGPGELLAAGYRRDDGPVLWRLVHDGHGWTCEPLPWSVHSDDFDIEFVLFEWAAVVPGTGGRQVVLGGEYDPVCTIDLDRHSMTRDRMLPGTACVVRYGGRPSLLAVDGSLSGGSVEVLPLGPDTTDAGEAPAFESSAGARLISLTATPDGDLVVAGTEDGQLLVWETTGPPARVIQIGSVPRRLAMCGPATVAVLTDLGLYSLELRPAASMPSPRGAS
ncbi:hypothetical protein GCM10009557_25310 [Virgisporangium ochraceum]